MPLQKLRAGDEVPFVKRFSGQAAKDLAFDLVHSTAAIPERAGIEARNSGHGSMGTGRASGLTGERAIRLPAVPEEYEHAGAASDDGLQQQASGARIQIRDNRRKFHDFS